MLEYLLTAVVAFSCGAACDRYFASKTINLAHESISKVHDLYISLHNAMAADLVAIKGKLGL